MRRREKSSSKERLKDPRAIVDFSSKFSLECFPSSKWKREKSQQKLNNQPFPLRIKCSCHAMDGICVFCGDSFLSLSLSLHNFRKSKTNKYLYLEDMRFKGCYSTSISFDRGNLSSLVKDIIFCFVVLCCAFLLV